MRKYKIEFDEMIELYENLFPDKKVIRINPELKSITPNTVAERLRESIMLSEMLTWKRQSKR